MATQTFQNQDKHVNQSASRIAIVGGGTAGWMTAALLSHSLSRSECHVTIIDDGKGGIGVGEATIPSIVQLVRTLGGDEAEFMRACDATWKLGIQFCDWKSDDQTAWHPFGQCGAQIDQRDLFSYWLADQQRPYHSYSVNWAAALAGKSPHARNSLSPIAATGAYAFHLDAAKLAQWLKQRAVSNGVEVVGHRATEIVTDDSGQISAVTLDDGSSVAGALFVDCSGFNSRLMSRRPSEEWVDASEQLLCDRAVTMRLPATKVKAPYTTAKAMSAGWAWDIPLMNRRGVGYVYSSQFVSDEEAAVELQQHVGVTESAETNAPSFLSMKVGRRVNTWSENVVAIGLAAGFVEPLESSGLHLIQTGVERLLKYFPTAKSSQASKAALRTAYNTETAIQFDEIVDFVQLHYLLNDRDEPFWKAAKAAPLSSALQHRLRLYDEIGMLDQLQASAFPDASYYYLLAGSGRLPKRPAALSLAVDKDRLQFVLRAILDQNRNALRELPLHEEMLQQVHATSVAKAS